MSKILDMVHVSSHGTIEGSKPQRRKPKTKKLESARKQVKITVKLKRPLMEVIRELAALGERSLIERGRRQP